MRFDNKSIKKINWSEIEPGMILLGGFQINNTVPDELKNYPVLTADLLEEIAGKPLVFDGSGPAVRALPKRTATGLQTSTAP